MTARNAAPAASPASRRATTGAAHRSSPARLRAALLTGLLVIGGATTFILATREPAVAGASGTCTAYIGGASSAKGAVPELVIFNTTFSTLTLDLKLLDPDGQVLIDRPAEIVVNGQQTLSVDLLEQFRRGLPKSAKPYAGTFTVQIDGPQGFSEDFIILHLTQYFGSKAKPKAAYILKPVFRDNGT